MGKYKTCKKHGTKWSLPSLKCPDCQDLQTKIDEIVGEFKTLFEWEDENLEANDGSDETEEMKKDRLAHWLKCTLMDVLATNSNK